MMFMSVLLHTKKPGWLKYMPDHPLARMTECCLHFKAPGHTARPTGFLLGTGFEKPDTPIPMAKFTGL
ncbi:MAG: hypothetical protein WBG17_07705 [Burkholderiaceae bacterium]